MCQGEKSSFFTGREARSRPGGTLTVQAGGGRAVAQHELKSARFDIIPATRKSFLFFPAQYGKMKIMKKNDIVEIVNDLLIVDPQKAGALGFMARPMVQVTLPHRDPGNVPSFARSAGDFRLIIQPLIDEKNGEAINYGIPYGSIPRLVLA